MTDALREAVARALFAEMMGADCDPDRIVADGDGNEMPWFHFCLDEAQTALTAIREAGYAIVPVEPTEVMLSAAYAACDEYGQVMIKHGYKAMIRANHTGG